MANSSSSGAIAPRTSPCAEFCARETLRLMRHYDIDNGDELYDALLNATGFLNKMKEDHVAGDTLPTSLWQFEQRANVLLDELTSRVNPDNALLGFICDAVRLARENERLAKSR